MALAFLSPQFQYRLKHGGGTQQAIAKACGVTQQKKPNILDATAGFGEEGFLLAYLGCQVHMLERSEVIVNQLHANLANAKSDLKLKEIIDKNIQVTHIDAKIFLSERKNDCFDVIYLDPMFPQRKKSSKIKQKMQLLQALVGDDQDADALFCLSLTKAKRRVVVKRSKQAPFLNHQKPDYSLTGKSTRFDVYLIHESVDKA